MGQIVAQVFIHLKQNQIQDAFFFTENNDKIYVFHTYTYLEDSSTNTYHSLNPPLNANPFKSCEIASKFCSDNSKLLLQIYLLGQQEVLMTGCLSYFWTDQTVSI